MSGTGSRRGVVIYLVAMIAMAIGLFVSILHYRRSVSRREFFQKREKVQAQFLARGAQQHFLLKIKYLAAPIYEAGASAVGRNPAYDFGAYMQSVGSSQVVPKDDLGVGPLFFTGGDATSLVGVPPTGDPQAPPGALILVVDRSSEPASPTAASGLFTGPAMPAAAIPGQSNRDVMAFLLEAYLLDITTTFPPPAVGPIVRIDSMQEYQDKASMGSNTPGDVLWRDPLTGNYFVDGFRMLGQGGGGSRAGKKFEADSVLVTTEAQVRVDGQVSPVTLVGPAPRRLDTMAPELQGQLVSKQGGSGWVELTLTSEDQAEFDLRAGASARRTEIVHATYLIRRPQ